MMQKGSYGDDIDQSSREKTSDDKPSDDARRGTPTSGEMPQSLPIGK